MVVPELLLAAQLSQDRALPLRIVTLGTSHTARGGWQTPLAEKLTGCLAKRVDVVNQGKSGANSQWGVGQVSDVAAAGPDIVLVEFAANDAALHGGISMSQSRDNIAAIVNGLRARLPGVRIILMAMNPMSGIRGALRPSLDDYYDLYRKLATTLNVEFLDHRPAWHRLSAHELTAAIPDGVHAHESAAAAVIVPALAWTICGSSAATQQRRTAPGRSTNPQ